MRRLTNSDMQKIHGGHPVAGALAAGAITAGVWALWTAYVDHRPEKVTPKKVGLTFALGTAASAIGIALA